MKRRERYSCSICGVTGTNRSSCPNHSVKSKREVPSQARGGLPYRLGQRTSAWEELTPAGRDDLLAQAKELLRPVWPWPALVDRPNIHQEPQVAQEPQEEPQEPQESEERIVIDLCRIDRTILRRPGGAQDLARVEAKLDSILTLLRDRQL